MGSTITPATRPADQAAYDALTNALAAAGVAPFPLAALPPGHSLEDRIVKHGEVRYFDHPKFGVVAKVLRLDATAD